MSILHIQPPPCGSVLINVRLNSNSVFTSVILPETGDKMGKSSVCDSTTPILSPILTSMFISGKLTKTTSVISSRQYVHKRNKKILD
jgi:hypothetical protein